MNIEADAAQAVAAAKTRFAHIIHPVHVVSIAQPNQENPVTQPQPQRVVDSLHAITGEIAANPLIARLAEHGLGKMLTGPEADSIATLIAGIEQPRHQVAANIPPHDGAQQQQ